MKDLKNFIKENKDPLRPWGDGVLSMGDDNSFLKQVWNYEIDSLKDLEVKTEEDLKLCKKSQSSGGRLKPLWKSDKLNLEWRLKCIKNIIKSKIENPEFIPQKYK